LVLNSLDGSGVQIAPSAICRNGAIRRSGAICRALVLFAELFASDELNCSRGEAGGPPVLHFLKNDWVIGKQILGYMEKGIQNSHGARPVDQSI
jgi:hypothetical protein